MWVTILLAVIGVALVAVSIVYFTSSAGHLPSFFPGHKQASGHKHTKHAIAALVVALIAFGGAWLSSGRKKTA
jgi:cell division protein FtsX